MLGGLSFVTIFQMFPCHALSNEYIASHWQIQLGAFGANTPTFSQSSFTVAIEFSEITLYITQQVAR